MTSVRQSSIRTAYGVARDAGYGRLLSTAIALGAFAADPEPKREGPSFHPPGDGAIALVLVLAAMAAWWRLKTVVERVR